jgi:hypothetical protein
VSARYDLPYAIHALQDSGFLASGGTYVARAVCRCRIHAVEARQDGDGTIPADLQFLADQLQAPEFARYKGFVLLDTKDFKLELGKVVDQKFKSGHNLELSLIGGEQDKLELHTNLKRGSKSLVDVNFVVGSNQIMLIPVRRGDQAIIFAYQCKS